MKVFSADFSGQLYKYENQLVDLKTKVDKISETVRFLEQGFREHAKQLVEWSGG